MVEGKKPHEINWPVRESKQDVSASGSDEFSCGNFELTAQDKVLNDLLICECGKKDDVKPIQFRNGWGKSANGYFKEIHNLCKACRSISNGSWRHAEHTDK